MWFRLNWDSGGHVIDTIVNVFSHAKHLKSQNLHQNLVIVPKYFENTAVKNVSLFPKLYTQNHFSLVLQILLKSKYNQM